MIRLWFPLYVNEFLASSKVALMTSAEVGAYILLLLHAWQDEECSLPTDEEELKRLARFTGDLARVKACFFTKNCRLYSKRLLHEWHKAQELSKKASTSARMRWHSEGNATAYALAMPEGMPEACKQQQQKNPEKKEKTKSLSALSARKLTALPDEEWLGQMRGDVLFHGLDLDLQFKKAELWCRAHKRNFTRKFFQGTWLVRALGEKPLQRQQEDNFRV